MKDIKKIKEVATSPGSRKAQRGSSFSGFPGTT